METLQNMMIDFVRQSTDTELLAFSGMVYVAAQKSGVAGSNLFDLKGTMIGKSAGEYKRAIRFLRSQQAMHELRGNRPICQLCAEAAHYIRTEFLQRGIA